MKLFNKFLAFLEKIGIIKKEEPDYLPESVLEEKNDEINEKALDIEPEATLEDVVFDFGTIMWCKRYSTLEEMYDIPDGHREGPFIIVGKDENGHIALYSTGVGPKVDINDFRILKLDIFNYADVLSKDTYISVAMDNTIRPDMIIKKMGSLTINDKNKLLKKMSICKREGLYVAHSFKVSYVPLEIGDVFTRKNKLYVVLDINDGAYTCVPFYRKADGTSIKYNGIRYAPSFLDSIVLDKHNLPTREDMIEGTLLEALLIRYRNYLSWKKNYGCITRGSVITFDDKYYYVNGLNGDTFTCIRIYFEGKDDMAKFSIGSDVFYTDFQEKITILQKDHPYTFYTNATEDEMFRIKVVKKDYMRKHKKGEEKPLYQVRGISTGSIVTNIYDHKRYIVITGNNNSFIVMSEFAFLTFNYNLRRMNANEILFVEKMHPITFKLLLKDLADSPEIIKNHVSKENIKKLIARDL